MNLLADVIYCGRRWLAARADRVHPQLRAVPGAGGRGAVRRPELVCEFGGGKMKTPSPPGPLSHKGRGGENLRAGLASLSLGALESLCSSLKSLPLSLMGEGREAREKTAATPALHLREMEPGGE